MKHFVDACEKSWLDKILILFWFWNLENDQWVVRDERNAAQETLFRTSNLFPVLHGQQLHIKSYSIHAHNEKKTKLYFYRRSPQNVYTMNARLTHGNFCNSL